MATTTEKLKTLLARDREVKISVIGRKSGKKISRPVWFVLDGDKLYLLPVQGSETQWYRNLLQNRVISISTRSAEGGFNGTPITDSKTVSLVVEKFRHKYGSGDVKKYYSKLDVAVVVDLATGKSVGKTDSSRHTPKK
ncbi:MAG: nitroreductase/quinone reductase family protein [Terriglobales bacterium]